MALPSRLSAVVLTTLSAEYVGSITPDQPAGSETSYVNFLKDMVPGTTFGTAPGAPNANYFVRSDNDLLYPNMPTAVFSNKDETGDNVFIVGSSTNLYVLGKYDAAQAGALVWFLGDFAGGIIEIPTEFNGHDLSHTSFFGGTGERVPDGGTTAVLLGSALLGLALIQRRLFC